PAYPPRFAPGRDFADVDHRLFRGMMAGGARPCYAESPIRRCTRLIFHVFHISVTTTEGRMSIMDSERFQATQAAGTQAPVTTWQAVMRGLRGRCPQCGEGKLFRAYLKVA